MRVIITGGGTAGHINPALAIAEEIKKTNPQWVILFVGSKRGMEETIVPKAGLDFVAIEISGFERRVSIKGIKHNIKAVVNMISSQKKCKSIIKTFKPDVVIGTGGYVSAPVIMTAQRMGIKTAIHEQNAYPGITTKALAKKADIVLGAVAEVKSRLKIGGKFFVVGNPVREGFIFSDKKASRKDLGIEADAKVILSSGGSLGSQCVNRAVAELMAWHAKKGTIYHIHSKGKLVNSWTFDEKIRETGVDITKSKKIIVKEYIENMPQWFAAADLIISRTGAMTLSEIECSGKASILIPSPNVTDNHQYYNAMVLVNRGAAIMIEEKNLTGKTLIHAVSSIIEDNDKLDEYSKRAQEMAIFDSAKRIINHIKDELFSKVK